MKYTLITGASNGMGREMVNVCAALGRNILLVALPNENLDKIAQTVAAEYKIKTDFFEGDLTKERTTQAIFDWTQEKKYKVDFLINNAGFGGVGPFDSYAIEYVNSMLDLNVKATTNLTHHFIPELKKNAPSFLLNNASMVANFPVPYKSIYAASKGYIRSFTRALREELAPFNVKVSVMQPGATPTNSIVKTQIETGGFFAKLSVADVTFVAKTGVLGTLNNKAIITPGFKNKMSLLGIKLFPPFLLQRILAKNTKKMKENE